MSYCELNDALVLGSAFEGCTENMRKIFYLLEKQEVKLKGLKCGLSQKCDKGIKMSA